MGRKNYHQTQPLYNILLGPTPLVPEIVLGEDRVLSDTYETHSRGDITWNIDFSQANRCLVTLSATKRQKTLHLEGDNTDQLIYARSGMMFLFHGMLLDIRRELPLAQPNGDVVGREYLVKKFFSGCNPEQLPTFLDSDHDYTNLSHELGITLWLHRNSVPWRQRSMYSFDYGQDTHSISIAQQSHPVLFNSFVLFALGLSLERSQKICCLCALLST